MRFLVEKGGSQAGVYPISTPAGSRRVPLLLTPLFLLGKRKITAQSGFPTVSCNCNWKKVKQKTNATDFSKIKFEACAQVCRSIRGFNIFIHENSNEICSCIMKKWMHRDFSICIDVSVPTSVFQGVPSFNFQIKRITYNTIDVPKGVLGGQTPPP